jgi:hypothetical protein
MSYTEQRRIKDVAAKQETGIRQQGRADNPRALKILAATALDGRFWPQIHCFQYFEK